MIKGVITVTHFEIENVSLRTVSNRGTSIAITLPKGWAEIGDKVCLAVKDKNTLIVSKRLMDGTPGSY